MITQSKLDALARQFGMEKIVPGQVGERVDISIVDARRILQQQGFALKGLLDDEDVSNKRLYLNLNGSVFVATVQGEPSTLRKPDSYKDSRTFYPI